MSKSKKFRKKADNYSTYSFKTKRIGGFKRYNKKRKTKQKARIGFELFHTRFISEMKKSFKESKSDWTYCWVAHGEPNNNVDYSHLDFAKHFSENPALKEKAGRRQFKTIRSNRKA